MPEVHVDGLALTGLSLTAVDAALTVRVDNPLPVDVGVANVRWSLVVADEVLVGGEDATARILPAGTHGVPIVVPVQLTYARVAATFASARVADEVPYRVEGSMDLVIGPTRSVTVGLGHEGVLPALAAPTFTWVDAAFGRDGAVGWVSAVVKVGMPAWVGAGTLTWTLSADERVLGSGGATLGAEGTLVAKVQVDASAVAQASWEVWVGEVRSLTLDVRGTYATSVGTLPFGGVAAYEL